MTESRDEQGKQSKTVILLYSCQVAEQEMHGNN